MNSFLLNIHSLVSAFGCTLPPTPINGRLVHAKENRVAKYACDSGFVFPDSGSVHRELNCLFSHTWDKILPDCIGESMSNDRIFVGLARTAFFGQIMKDCLVAV